jgi:hypothetical protein
VADCLVFSPLRPDETAAAPAIAKPVRSDREIVAPLPLDTPAFDVKFKGRKPDEILWFRNEKGERLFAECRWNLEDGAKEVRPACYTARGWKLVACPAPRPLYNRDARSSWTSSGLPPLNPRRRAPSRLDKLAARPDDCSRARARPRKPRHAFRAP